MFMVLQIRSSGRHPWVRQGTEEVTLLWPLCLGLEMLEWTAHWRPHIISAWHLWGLEAQVVALLTWWAPELGWPDRELGSVAVCCFLVFLGRWSARGT